jgi:hypothetical protein
MSKTKIEEKVMDQIQEGKVKMLPKAYFVGGAVLGGFGVLAAAFSFVYLINVALFAFKHNGPGSNLRVEYMLAAFPLWILIPMLVFIATGVISVVKSDLFYKHRGALLLGLFVAILVGVMAVELLGFNKLWEKRYPLRLRRLHMQNLDMQERKGNQRLLKDRRFSQ